MIRLTLLIILLISLVNLGLGLLGNENTNNNNYTNNDCLIQNFKYSTDYLHVSKKLDLSNFFDINSYTRRIYTNSPSSLKDMDKYRWKFILLNNNLNNPQYIIKNSKYDEYLCSSARHQSALFKKRRNVYTRRVNDKKMKWMLNRNDVSCIWRIDNIQDQVYMDHRYLIWNVKYNESLYAASSLFTTVNDERSVFTWFDQPDSDQFYWLIHCIF